MVLERTYIIPLRKQILKSPKYKRAKKAVRTVKEFLRKHMKVSEVKLGRFLNEDLWKRGMKNPPVRIKVNVIKNDKGEVSAELFGKELVKPKAPKKKGLISKLTGKSDEKVSKKAVKKEAKAGEKKIKEELEKLKEKTSELKKESESKTSEVKTKDSADVKTEVKSDSKPASN